MQIPILAVVGPTASGKTALAVELAKHFNGEVVSADSMQIYKYLNIATAKPDEAEKYSLQKQNTCSCRRHRFVCGYTFKRY